MKSSFSVRVLIVLMTTCCDSTNEFNVFSHVACLLTKPSRRASIASKRVESDATRVLRAATASRSAATCAESEVVAEAGWEAPMGGGGGGAAG